MQIISFENNYEKIWDEYVLNHDEGHVYHLSSWKKVVEKAYRCKTEYYLLCNHGKINGIIPFFKIRRLNTKNYLISLPYANYGGMLLNTGITTEEVISMLNWGGKRLELREYNCPRNSDSQTVTFLLNLPECWETLWDGFTSKVRQNIRKAERSNIHFLTEGQYLNNFYRIYSINMKRLGTPKHKRHFFKNILNEFQNKSDIWVITKEDQIIGAVLMFFFKKTAYNFLTMILPGFENIRASMFLNWNIMKKSIEMGFKTFDFGRSTINTGTYHFKKRWGAREKTLNYYVIHNFKKYRQNVPQPGILSKVWSKSPRFFTDSVGPLIRKFVF